MNWKLSILSISAALIFIACSGQSEQKSEHPEANKEETVAAKTYYYTCPMEAHKHIASDKPGDCSECGMKLVAATEVQADSAEYFGCPMPQHSHIRHDKAGKCEECNMDLKSMRLVKK
jgi:ABC-type Fe3+-hydroxamate transport system substrate-binding protein